MTRGPFFFFNGVVSAHEVHSTIKQRNNPQPGTRVNRSRTGEEISTYNAQGETSSKNSE